jgi:hypothetical protein
MMRRITTAVLTGVAALALVAVGNATIGDVNVAAPTLHHNSCPPAQAAACDTIVTGVKGVIARGAAYAVIGFVTPN